MEQDERQLSSISEQQDSKPVLIEESPAPEKILFTAEYKLTFEVISQALRQFSKLYKYKTKLVQTVLLAIISVIFIIDFIRLNYILYLILGAISAGMLLYLWVTPLSRRKSVAASIAEQNATFRLVVKDSEISITEQQTETVLPFQSPMTIYETQTCFLVHVDARRLFPIPKEDLGEENCKIAAEVFERELKERFLRTGI